MASRLVRAFPDAMVAPDGRKSWVRNLSEGFRQKPRPLGRRTGNVLMGASRTTSQSARYRVPRSSHVTGRLRVQKVCISSIDFVVKTTRGGNNAPFDVVDDIVRRHATTPSTEGVASGMAALCCSDVIWRPWASRACAWSNRCGAAMLLLSRDVKSSPYRKTRAAPTSRR